MIYPPEPTPGENFVYRFHRTEGGVKVYDKVLTRLIATDETTNAKYFQVIGAYRAGNIRLLGEIIAVARPQNVKKTTFPFWTVPSLYRAGDLGLQNVLLHKAILDTDVRVLEDLVPLLAHQGKAIRDDPVRLNYTCKLLDILLSNYERAETVHRLAALDRFQSAVGITDVLDRYNPSATAAKARKAKDELQQQQEFDLNTLGSMSNRKLISIELADRYAARLERIRNLFASGDKQRIGKLADALISQLVLKPANFVRLYYENRKEQSDFDSSEMVDVCNLELQLWEIDDARSMLDKNPHLRTAENVQLLQMAIESLAEVGGAYSTFVQKLTEDATALEDAVVRGDQTEFNRANQRMRNHYRYRSHARTPKKSYWRQQVLPSNQSLRRSA